MQHQTLQDKLCMYECRKKECIYEKSNPHEMQKNIHTRLIQDYERCLFGKICLIRDVLSFIYLLSTCYYQDQFNLQNGRIDSKIWFVIINTIYNHMKVVHFFHVRQILKWSVVLNISRYKLLYGVKITHNEHIIFKVFKSPESI